MVIIQTTGRSNPCPFSEHTNERRKLVMSDGFRLSSRSVNLIPIIHLNGVVPN